MGGMPMGFPKKNHKFYEATTIPSESDHSRFKDNIKDMETFINTQKVAPVEEGETKITFIGKDYRKSKKNFNQSVKKASGTRKRKTKTRKGRRKQMRRKKSRKRL